MMITRFNVSIAVLCMVDGDGGPPPASTSLASPLEEGERNKTGGAATWQDGELYEMGETRHVSTIKLCSGKGLLFCCICNKRKA